MFIEPSKEYFSLVPYVIPFVGALIFGVALASLGSVLCFQKARMARQPQVTVERATISSERFKSRGQKQPDQYLEGCAEEQRSFL